MITREVPLSALHEELDRLQISLLATDSEVERAYIQGARRVLLWLAEGLPLGQLTAEDLKWLH